MPHQLTFAVMSMNCAPEHCCWGSLTGAIELIDRSLTGAVDRLAGLLQVPLSWLTGLWQVLLTDWQVGWLVSSILRSNCCVLICRALAGLAAGAADSFPRHCGWSLCVFLIQCHFRQVATILSRSEIEFSTFLLFDIFMALFQANPYYLVGTFAFFLLHLLWKTRLVNQPVNQSTAPVKDSVDSSHRDYYEPRVQQRQNTAETFLSEIILCHFCVRAT